MARGDKSPESCSFRVSLYGSDASVLGEALSVTVRTQARMDASQANVQSIKTAELAKSIHSPSTLD
jgi:hypothetical protein